MKEFLKPVLGKVGLDITYIYFNEIVEKLNTIEMNTISGEDLFFLQAEIMAFQFFEKTPFYDWSQQVKNTPFHPCTLKNKSGEKIIIPDANQITEKEINYWKERALEEKNVVLCARYAGLVWDLCRNVHGYKKPLEMAILRIDSVLKIIKTKNYKNIHEVFPQLEHIIKISILIHDDIRKNEIIGAILGNSGLLDLYTSYHTYDALFDNKGIVLKDFEKEIIIKVLENHLNILTTECKCSGIIANFVKEISTRLAKFYHKNGDQEKKQISLKKYFDFIIKCVPHIPTSLEAQNLLKEALQVSKNYGQDNSELLLMVQEVAKDPHKGIDLHHVQVTIPMLDSNILNSVVNTTLEKALDNFVGAFLLKKSYVEGIYKDNKSKFPISHYASKSEVKNSGIPEIFIDGKSRDEIELINLAKNQILTTRLGITQAMQKIFSHYNVSSQDLYDYFAKKLKLSKGKLPILKCALEMYINNNFIGAMHVFLTIIEESLRQSLRSSNNSFINKQNKSGGYDEKLLDNLLNDSYVIEKFGVDRQFYLRVVLVERPGFNFRNNFLHGLMNSSDFNQLNVDLIFYVLLILAEAISKHDENSI